MMETELSPIHSLSSGLCEDPSRMAASLIRRMANDDPTALLELYSIWGPVFLGIATRMLGDPQQAEEVVQDTFVRIWNGSADYNPHHSPPLVWAFTMMRGYCIERLHSRNRSKKDASRAVLTPLSTASEKFENPRVMAADDYRRVRAALNQLAPDERGCLELAVFLKYTHSEILKHPDTPIGTVKNQLRHALKKMRNQLSRYEL